LEKEKREGVMDKTSIFFILIQNRTEGAHRVDLQSADGGRPGYGGGREWGEQREEVEGDSFLSSPRVGAACGGRSTAAGGL
jgi:hypothetical protein